MVTSEIAQLPAECNTWRNELRAFRDEFTQFKMQLQNIAGRQKHKETLLEIEHLNNQFHIQLINIHDLKHSIKLHQRNLSLEEVNNMGRYSDPLLTRHEELHDQYESLSNTLIELREDFVRFSNVI